MSDSTPAQEVLLKERRLLETQTKGAKEKIYDVESDLADRRLRLAKKESAMDDIDRALAALSYGGRQ